MTDYNLYELLIPWIHDAPKCNIHNIVLNSNDVSLGDLFVAISGNLYNGKDFIQQAIMNGAAAIITDTSSNILDRKIYNVNGIPMIGITNLNKHLSALAGRFYQYPGKKQKLIGITGTNGKTTTSLLLAQWIQLMGEISAVMGTIGNGLLGNLVPSENTTCSAIKIQHTLDMFVKNGVSITVLEVSSHALIQHRVAALPFVAGIFTNLTHDHLDYHKNMKNYELAKWLLFSKHQIKEYIINSDDPVGYRWLEKLPNAIAVTLKNNLPHNYHGRWIKVNNISYNNNCIVIMFNSSWGKGKIINNCIIGDFNINNLLLALATLLSLGYTKKDLLSVTSQLKLANGRMEKFNIKNKPTVILDYAHTPEALKKTLEALRLICKNKLWCVFGCGGDRDKDKRPLMGRIAEQFADIIIITNDNPRSEDPNVIIDNIINGIIKLNHTKIIFDRSKAITYSIMNANSDDIILVAGKGHEEYQIIGNEYLKYSDKKIIKYLLEKKI